LSRFFAATYASSALIVGEKPAVSALIVRRRLIGLTPLTRLWHLWHRSDTSDTGL